MKTIAIMQSNYIPWKGFFDLVRCSDAFVFLDCVQYTKNDWRNRNRIIVNGKPLWLTIPVITKGQFGQKINETKVVPGWHKKHWKTVQQAYRKAPYFTHYKDKIENAYHAAEACVFLHEVNRIFYNTLAAILTINTPIYCSSAWTLSDDPSKRVLQIVQHLSGTVYLSGPAAQNYLDQNIFDRAGIKIIWADYTGYKPYNQLSDQFDHSVSVLDLIFNEGPGAVSYLSDIAQVIQNG